MAHSGTKITGQVQIRGDLQPVLGTGLDGLGRIITAANINKWARFKPTPATASSFASASARLSAFVNAGFALTMPMYSTALFSSHYADKWGYRRPTGTIGTAPFRLLDFTGYQHSDSAWTLGGSTSTMLCTIFGGRLQISGTMMGAGDAISMTIDCNDSSELGLLYPKDFDGSPSSAYGVDISHYYAGIAIVSGSSTWVVTAAEQLGTHTTESDYASMVRTTLPSSVPNGPIKIVPVLCNSAHTSWSTDGTLINLDGAYLDATKVATSPNLKYTVTFNATSSKTSVSVNVQNQTGAAKNFYAYAYLLSYGAYINEHDGGSYVGPDFQGEGAAGFISRKIEQGVMPPKSGDIYSHDWDGGYSSPDDLAGRMWSVQATQISIPNNGSQSYSHDFNFSGDNFGSYTDYPPVLIICAYEGGTYVTRVFEAE